MVILNETIMINAIPRLMVDFDVDASAAQWLSTAFMLTMAVVIPITGWFLQRVTTRFAFGLAMATFCTGTLLAALAWSFPVLLVARVIQASGTAVMMPLLMTTLMAIVPDARPRPRDGQRHAGHVGGTRARPGRLRRRPAVAVVALDLPRRAAHRGRASGPSACAGCKNVGEPVPGTVDWWSVVIAAIGFGTLVYGLTEIGAVGDHTTAYAALAIGVLGVGGFVWRQILLQREDKPLLDLRTLKLRVFSISLGAMSVAFMAMLGSMILLQLYLQNVRGMSPLATGMLVMPGGLAMGLLGPRVGRVYDARGSRVLVLPGAVGLLGSMTLLAFLSSSTPTWQILVVHVVLMVSLAALFTPLFTMGLGVLPPHLYSHGSSLLGTTQQVAGAMGTALVVTIMSGRAASQVREGVGSGRRPARGHAVGVRGLRGALRRGPRPRGDAAGADRRPQRRTATSTPSDPARDQEIHGADDLATQKVGGRDDLDEDTPVACPV